MGGGSKVRTAAVDGNIRPDFRNGTPVRDPRHSDRHPLVGRIAVATLLGTIVNPAKVRGDPRGRDVWTVSQAASWAIIAQSPGPTLGTYLAMTVRFRARGPPNPSRGTNRVEVRVRGPG